MPSSPQPAVPTPSNISGAVAEDLALYREKFRRRLPESLDELHGPTQGIVELPLHMAWSGMTSYDLGKPRQRMGLYRTVLHEGLHDDLPRYLNQGPAPPAVAGAAHPRRPHRARRMGRRLPPARLPHPGSRVTDMPELHTRLLADVIALGSPYPLVLTGGYAVRAHRLVNRPSQDLDVATQNPAPMADIAATLRAGLEARGWKVHALETAPLSARFTVTDPATGQECEVDILKEIFWRPVTQSRYGPVLAEEDVFAASRRWSNAELEEFGRRHARGRFEREDLQSNLMGAEWTDDEAFTAYGLDEATISALRTWALQWADDLAARLLEEAGDPDTD